MGEPDRPRLMTLDEAVNRVRLAGNQSLTAAFPNAVLLVSSSATGAGEDAAASATTAGPGQMPTQIPSQIQDGSNAVAAVVIPLAPLKLRADPKRLVVGRSTVCDVQLVNAWVSKVHAYLWEDAPGRWLVQDAGSSHGTAVGGQLVPRDAGVPVDDRAVIVFAGVVATFRTADGFRAELQRLSSAATKRTSPFWIAPPES